MGSIGIPIHFEPSILGAEYIWCTACGRVLGMEEVVWRTTSFGASKEEPTAWVMKDGEKRWAMPRSEGEYRWIKEDLSGLPEPKAFVRPPKTEIGGLTPVGQCATMGEEESPHSPFCPCGQSGVIGEAIYDGSLLRLKDRPVFYPLRKPLTVWNKVKPYRTKKGKTSEWKPDAKAGAEWTAIYKRLQERTCITYEGEELDGNLAELMDVYGDVKVSLDVHNLSAKNGLVVLRGRSVWHGAKKLGWRKDVKTKRWFDLERVNTWLNDHELSMARGGIENVVEPVYPAKIVGTVDTIYQRGLEMMEAYHDGTWKEPIEVETMWYDRDLKKWVVVAQDLNWVSCSYDESQGRDTADDDGYEKAIDAAEEAVSMVTEEPVEEGSESEETETAEIVGELSLDDLIVDRGEALLKRVNLYGRLRVINTLRNYATSRFLEEDEEEWIRDMIQELSEPRQAICKADNAYNSARMRRALFAAA